jgi:hypothetical protein
MFAKNILSEQIAAGWLLILGSIIFVPSGLLFSGRAIFKWPSAQSQGYLYLERGLVMACFIVSALGFVLLDKLLEAAGDRVLSSVGLTIFLIGTILVLAAETIGLGQQETVYALIVAFVILAFIGQAVFGASILRSGLLPGWVGWATIVWNLAWLVILPIARPQDVYYPWLHHMAPLLIGIALITKV